MKVALIGNMNNNFFAITRYLRDRGVDAHLFLLGEHQHFKPSADTFSDSYLNFVHETQWIENGFFNNDSNNQELIRRDLEGFDATVGCGYAPFFLARAGLSLDLFLPYGSDLYEVPFTSLTNIQSLLFKGLFWFDSAYRALSSKDAMMHVLRKVGLSSLATSYRQYKLARYQTIGIKSTKHIISQGAGDNFKQYMDKLVPSSRVNKSPIPCLYLCQTPPVKPSIAEQRIQQIRTDFDVIIFHHARHSWENAANPESNKRNDILINGLHQYLQTPHAKSVALVTLEYGPDVPSSKKLINALELNRNVFWFPMLERREILRLIPYADIGAVDFGMSWISGGVLYEFMSCEKPILQYRNDELYTEQYPDLYPILNVHESNDVCAALERYAASPSMFKQLGIQAHAWFQVYVIEKPIKLIIQKIEQSISLNRDSRR